MKALLWYWQHFHLCVEAFPDMEAAARREAAVDDEWSCAGCEVFAADGTRTFHPFVIGGDRDANPFMLRVREIQDERYERWRAEAADEPRVVGMLTVAPPPEIEKGEPATVAWLHDANEEAAVTDEWSFVGDRLGHKSPR